MSEHSMKMSIGVMDTWSNYGNLFQGGDRMQNDLLCNNKHLEELYEGLGEAGWGPLYLYFTSYF